jgi:cell division protein FtsZ
MKFEFVEEKERYLARIKVIGVGGAGGNAINNMINSNLKGVDFVAGNTDCQALERSVCGQKIRLGPSVTMGLGAGADPDVGKAAAEESIAEIRELMDGYDMVFITAGMGGGTGTGASPIIARECRQSGALTVAVVTKPFHFEGGKRMKRALQGIEALREEVDTLIVIPNERLKSIGGRSTSFKDLVARADDVLLQAVRGIADLIQSSGFINLDFADVRTVMAHAGTAIMGSGRATGENRAMGAAQMAINSPLLEGVSIGGAKGLLMNITGNSNMTMDEVDEASNFIGKEAGEEAEVLWGVVFDEAMEDEMQVTVIATGIEDEDHKRIPSFEKVYPIKNKERVRDPSPEESREDWDVKVIRGDLEDPTYIRQRKELSAGHEDTAQRELKRGLLDRLRHRNNLDYPTFLRVKAD